MRHVESKYREYPVALELPALESDLQASRALAINDWTSALGIRYNYDYVCFEFTEGTGFRAKTFMAWAFKDRRVAIQFKLAFGGWQ